MHTAKSHERDVFIDVIEKLRLLSSSQQRFIKEMIVQPEKTIATSQKELLKKSFGVWADRKDISNSLDYVYHIRAGWGTRLGREKG